MPTVAGLQCDRDALGVASARASSTFPWARASSGGVSPSLLRTSVRAPDSSSSAIMALSPKSIADAQSSGVIPSLST